jgi:Flp pilus assembly protein TadD
MLAGLAAGTLALFGVTSALSRTYHAHLRGLAQHWSGQGEAALRAGRPKDAVQAFENARHYARHDTRVQMRLAEALLLAGRSEEARSHLLALWARAPGDGRVNLELGRLAAAGRHDQEAVRHFDAAVHGSWEVAADVARRRARQELIAHYLDRGALPQAEAQLIALAPELPPDADTQTELGRSFLKTGDARRALVAFRAARAAQPRDARATAGAGQASFQLGDYMSARRYLRAAAPPASDDEAVRRALATTEFVLTMDPFRSRLGAAERARRVELAWRTTMTRVQACAERQGVTLSEDPRERPPDLAPPLWHAHRQLAALGPGLASGALRRHAERIYPVMDAVVAAARTVESCRPLEPADEALLLIGRRHEAERP